MHDAYRGGTANPRYANGARRRALASRVKSLGTPCHICGLPIDRSLPARHPLSFELDELVPVSRGGSPIDPQNVAASHRCCNQWRGAKPLDLVAKVRDVAAKAYGQWRSPLEFVERARAVMRSARKNKKNYLSGASPVAGIRTPIASPKKNSGAL